MLFLWSCSGSSVSSRSDGVGTVDVPVLSATTALNPAPPLVVAPAGCTSHGAIPCAEFRTVDENRQTAARIQAAHKAVAESLFADAALLVELARLQLVRDEASADSDGPDDDARAKLSALRAIVVGSSNPAARLMLALTLARTRPELRGTSARASLLALIETALSGGLAADGSVGAGIATMKGLIAIERGDHVSAKKAFEQATNLDPSLRSAWVGLGDIARATGAFEDATKSYERAQALGANDPAVVSSIEAAKRRTAFVLPPPTTEPVTPLAPGMIVPPITAVTRCNAQAVTIKEGERLCKSLDQLAIVTGEQVLGSVTNALDAIRGLDGACRQKRPECGPHVTSAYFDIARGFSAAGQLPKAIATLRLVINLESSLPGGAEASTTAMGVVGDLYYSTGIFDAAATWYEKYADRGGANASAAAARAFHVKVGLGLAREAQLLLTKHRALLGDGAAERADALLREPAGPECGPLFGCSVLRLAGEERWSTAARRP